MSEAENITGIVLAGGKSSRMGCDKGMLDFQGKPMVEHVISTLELVVDKIIISANSEEYNRFGWPVVNDIFPNCGPMGGIYTALEHSSTEKNLVVSCDIPLIKPNILQYLINHSGHAEVTVPVHDQAVEPLCAIYSKSCTPKFEKLLNQQQFKMKNALELFDVQRLDVSHLAGADYIFSNINTPKELEKWK